MKNSNRVRWSAAVVVFVVALGHFGVQARPVDEVKLQDVIRILQYKPDPTPRDFVECGSDIDSVLADVLSSRNVKPEIRVRAARTLGLYPGTRARAVLTSTMTTPDEDRDVRAASMFGLARLVGGAAIDDIKAWLKDPSPVVRSGAAVALAQIGGPRARQILMDTIAHESDLDVRLKMDQALNRMSEQESRPMDMRKPGAARPGSK